MIIIDTSAAVAVIARETERDGFLDILGSHDSVLPVSCYLETVMVLRSKGPDGRRRLDRLLAENAIAILPCDAAQAWLAADAFERFGRGSGHAAKLNFGDCLSYAAARAKGAPLLFKGEDFVHTDVARAG